eukprot:8683734-Prorocentrum_lima.AAC.1
MPHGINCWSDWGPPAYVFSPLDFICTALDTIQRNEGEDPWRPPQVYGVGHVWGAGEDTANASHTDDHIASIDEGSGREDEAWKVAFSRQWFGDPLGSDRSYKPGVVYASGCDGIVAGVAVAACNPEVVASAPLPKAFWLHGGVHP